MYQLKALLYTVSLCAALLATLMIWFEDRLSVSYELARVLEILFICASLLFMHDAAQLRVTED